MPKIPPFRVFDGETIKLNLHPAQQRVWDSPARFVFFLAGTQSGKTVLVPHWLEHEMRQRGPGDYLAVSPTYPLLRLKLLPECRLVFETLLKLGTYSESQHTLRVSPEGEQKLFGKRQKEPTRLIFGSATHPESLESATAKAAALDECGQRQFRRETYEAVLRRLSIHEGRLLGTTTPYNLGWLKQEVYDRWSAGDHTYDVIQADSSQNPAFPPAEYERARRSLPAWKFDLFYRGRFSRPAGLIYESFNPDICRVGRFPIPHHWLVYAGHDFGGANPAAMFYARDPSTGYSYAFAEYLPGPGRATAQHVAEFKRITAGLHVLKRAGGSHQESEIRQGYAAHGWPIAEPKLHEVEAGIDRVYALHALNKVFVFDDLTHYLEEKMSYARVLDAGYQPTDDIEDKARFHLMDAERYILSDFMPETACPAKPMLKGWQ